MYSTLYTFIAINVQYVQLYTNDYFIHIISVSVCEQTFSINATLMYETERWKDEAGFAINNNDSLSPKQ